MKINYLKSDFVLLGEDNQRTEMLADLSVVIVTLQSLTLKFSCQPGVNQKVAFGGLGIFYGQRNKLFDIFVGILPS